jgi:hypothetical protein
VGWTSALRPPALILLLAASAAACRASAPPGGGVAVGPGAQRERRVLVRSHAGGLRGVRVGSNATVAVRRDPEAGGDPVLAVSYGAQGEDPADRDVWCDTGVRDWSGARALVFRVRSDEPLHLAVSFFDANGVGYTAWADTRGGGWEEIRVALDTIQPNPYFQPPTAKLGAPLDLHDVRSLGFAPQVPDPGRFVVAAFEVLR